MAHQSELIARDIHAYLKQQEEKGMLRFITCGSVDDGKSTLIGRLLWDSKMIFEDQLTALEADSRRVGTQGQNIDYALLLDGLEAEREQGITIDVAYRFFSTDKRKFIVADTPGHEQYTRNMVTGASNAQVAVILVDARKGVLTQTRRHSYLASLVGIRHVVLAINKMDLVDYSEQRFNEILQEYQGFAASLGFEEIRPIPLSALNGDNVIAASAATPWYQGPPLMEYLENVQVAENAQGKPFRMRVQWVNRPDLDFRGFCGTIAAGVIRPGDPVVVTSSGQKSRIARIVTMDGDLARAVAGQAVTLTLEDEIDISRGETLAAPQERPYFEDHFEAKLVWLHEEALVPGRDYLLKAGASLSPARVEELRFKVNVNSLQQEPGSSLALNEIGVCRLRAAKPISFDSYRENRATGSFILIDRVTNATVGAGMIHQPLRSSRQGWPEIEINREARAALKNQKTKVLWFDHRLDPQLPSLVEKRLYSLGRHSMPLADQGAGKEALAESALLLYNAGLIVLVQGSETGADHLRSRFAPGDFIEIHRTVANDENGNGSHVTIDDHAPPIEQAEHLVRSLDL
ncbi:MAG TPA: sulfate adenylyltransferase subunit CysN [Geoalkalibacter subterraneus]|uniref:Sulfate adenylyltransferase subunit 1 n=1 Tax=Geoalkalibacter subterraneus TaxID=483547 RepID=A0A831LDL0_9BACT|nr:sulfate adenylyltransferase subunit CysN [Geoalkalibacter subterraneus]